MPASAVTFIDASSMSFDLTQSHVQSLGAGNHSIQASNADGASNPLALAISNSSINAPTVIAQSPAPNAQVMIGSSVLFSALIQNDVSTEPLHVQVWGSQASPVNYILVHEATFHATPAGLVFSVNLLADQPPGNYLWSISATNPTNPSLIGYSVPAAMTLIPSACSGAAPLCPLQVGVCANAQQACVGSSYAACTPTTYGQFYQAVESSCSDGLDNDCDTGSPNGGSDCSDSDCSATAACLTCGDNTCDEQTETCSSCALDCGACAPPNSSPNNSSFNSGSGGGGGGSGGGSGSGSSSSPTAPPAAPPGGGTPGSGQVDNGAATETGNPITDILADIGHTVVSAVSVDAAQNLGVNLMTGFIILMLAAFVIVHFLGFV
ncbi:MAG: hypothetical protein IPJ89_03860 [Candidatus Iainarchaeum archaeon]|uniref:Uncharacterized protein n=1 Tax=Candidatus Iainarchaeum sp. TaxID=3101447 RepID=A0A7T9DJ25_9ARCH|nr:MAG: hypothetical protein IPJ89_03860 [Candidatus Diapherotrites archaeon]